MRSQSIRTIGSSRSPAALPRAPTRRGRDARRRTRARRARAPCRRPVSEKCSCVRSASCEASSQLPDQHSSSVRLSRMLASDDSSPSSTRGVLGQVELAARAVEVVDIAKPLAELEDDRACRRPPAARAPRARARAPRPRGRARRRGRGRRGHVRRVPVATSDGSASSLPCEQLERRARRLGAHAADRSSRPTWRSSRAARPEERVRRLAAAPVRQGRPPPTRRRASSRCRRARAAPGRAVSPRRKRRHELLEQLGSRAGSHPRGGGGPRARAAAPCGLPGSAVSCSASSVSSAAVSGAPRARAPWAAASSTRAAPRREPAARARDDVRVPRGRRPTSARTAVHVRSPAGDAIRRRPTANKGCVNEIRRPPPIVTRPARPRQARALRCRRCRVVAARALQLRRNASRVAVGSDAMRSADQRAEIVGHRQTAPSGRLQSPRASSRAISSA